VLGIVGADAGDYHHTRELADDAERTGRTTAAASCSPGEAGASRSSARWQGRSWAPHTQGLSARRGPPEPVYLPLGPFLLVGAFVAIALLPPLLAASAGGRVAATSRRSRWR